MALLRMDRDGLIDLPPSVRKKGRRQRRLALSAASNPREPVQGSVRALEPLIFQRVEMGPLSSLWNELIQRYHYLGYRPLCGAQMRYLVWSADRRLLAALGFGASAWQVKARDQHIGWNHPQRLGGLHRIVNNARFLILPLGQVLRPGLADSYPAFPHHCGPTGSCATAMNRCCWKASWKCHAFPVPPTKRPIGCGSEKLEAEANLKKTTNKLPHLKKSGFIRCTRTSGKSSALRLDPLPTRCYPKLYHNRLVGGSNPSGPTLLAEVSVFVCAVSVQFFRSQRQEPECTRLRRKWPANKNSIAPVIVTEHGRVGGTCPTPSGSARSTCDFIGGSICRTSSLHEMPEALDKMFFWNRIDLERKLEQFKSYYNQRRVHQSLDGATPEEKAGRPIPLPVELSRYGWQSYCNGLFVFELPVAA